MNPLRVWIPGTPVPQGSMRAFAFKRKNGKLGASVTSDNKRTMPWRDTVKAHVNNAMRDAGIAFAPRGVPVTVSACFYFERPADHYGTGKNAGKLKASAPRSMIVKKADIDKLLRAVLDALTGVAYFDDCQVNDVRALRSYVAETHTGLDLLIEWNLLA